METLWSDFINSEWHDWRGSGQSEDRLDQEKWQADFIEQWGLKVMVPADGDMLDEMRDFRATLQEMSVRFASGGAATDKDLEYLNCILDKGPVKRRLTSVDGQFGIRVVPMRDDWTQVMAEVAASLAKTLIDGEIGRIRVCDNPDCRWVFYDDTRNRTKKYCEDKTCGNLMKVRRFRARKKQEQDIVGDGQANRE